MKGELLGLARQLRRRLEQDPGQGAWLSAPVPGCRCLPGAGAPTAEVFFIGDGPTGELFDKILGSIGLSRQDVFVADITSCGDTTGSCRGFLDEQIRQVAPRVIVTLGAAAARELLGETSITRVRGQWREYSPAGGPSIRVLPTYHPAALLRDPDLKKDVWTDMKNLRTELSS